MSDDLRFDQLLREDASGLPPAMADVNPWREAMWLVLWGMGLTTITFHFLYLDLLLPALGGILMVLGFRTLRRENKALQWCWRLSIVIAAVRSASFVLEALPVDVKYVPAYAVMVMTFALYIGLWRGMVGVSRAAGAEKPAAPAAGALVIFYAVLGTLAFMELNGWLAVLPLLIVYIVILRNLVKLARSLSDMGYAIHAAPVRLPSAAVLWGYLGLTLAAVPEFFDVLLHLGTLVAVFVAYWRDICDMVMELIHGVNDLAHGTTPRQVPPARRLILLIIVGTLPLFAVLPIHKQVQALSNNMVFIGAALVVTGFLLFACDLVRKGRKTERNATLADVLVVGVGQAIATMPGISRSGMTITTGCFMGFERKFAVRFSFLLSIPAVLGANILSLKDAIEAGIVWAEVPMYLVGVVTAAVVGYVCIRLLRMVAEKGRFGAFAYYCWAAGLLTLLLNAIK